MSDTQAVSYDAEQIIARYIHLRDFVKAEKAAFNDRMKPYTDAMEALEGAAAQLMKATGQTKLSADSGTAFPVPSTSYKVAEPDKWHTWVQTHQLFGMYTNHVSKEALEAYLEETKDPDSGAYNPPPGIAIEGHVSIQFRRG